jgi:hypothetical protein
MPWLKQSTAASVMFGPFVSEDDGYSACTGLAVDASMINVSKNGATIAAMNSSTSPEHDANGYYLVELDTTDTGTLGTLKVMASVSPALPVWMDFMVAATEPWDTLFGTDSFTVDVNGGVLSASDVLGESASIVDGTAASHSLYSLIQMALESSLSGSEWTVYQTDGTTPWRVLSASLDGTASPIVAVG